MKEDLTRAPLRKWGATKALVGLLGGFCLCASAQPTRGVNAAELYGRLTGKTILLSSSLPNPAIADLPAEKINAVAKIEAQFAERGISVIQDGPHFVRLLPKQEAEDIARTLPLRGTELAATRAQETVGPGLITFRGADTSQVLNIYAALSGRTVLRPARLPCPPVNLESSCSLSKAEVVYAIRTVLGLNGISIAEDGGKFVQIVETQHLGQVRTNAPKSLPGAKLLDPNKLQSVVPKGAVPPLVPPKPVSEAEREFLRLEKALLDFIHYKAPPDLPAKRLLDFYAAVADKTPQSSKTIDVMPVWFHIETPLTKDELLYAIETTFRLGGIGIVPVSGKTIRLGGMTEASRPAGDQPEQQK